MDIFTIANKIKDFIVFLKEFLWNLPWGGILSALKVLAVIASILLLVGIIYIFFVLKLIDRFKRILDIAINPRTLPKKKLAKKWEKIAKRLEVGNEAELKLAVIEADKFFDDILKKIGLHGSDMGERLRKINVSQISNINDIWSAHKVRNNIVHQTGYKLTAVDAQKSVEAYKKGLGELEALWK